MQIDSRFDAMAKRQSRVVGVHSVDHYSLAVPDLAEAETFYTRFGLRVRAAGETLELYTEGNAHRWARYHEQREKSLQYVSFGIYAEDVITFRDRLEQRGIQTHAAPADALDDSGLWFEDPDGIMIELRVAAKCSPDVKTRSDNPLSGPGVAGAPLRSDAPAVRPRRLSHILLFVSDVDRAVEFYSGVVGLALSDAAADIVAFMHGVHGSDHHLVAFAKSDSRGFHHVSWDVESFNEVGMGAMLMADAGHTRGWGLGRHVLGSNYFHYVRDPWGSYSEYSNDIDFVPPDGKWRASRVSPDNGFYLWGPNPPDDFAYNYESPAASLTRELVASEPHGAVRQ